MLNEKNIKKVCEICGKCFFVDKHHTYAKCCSKRCIKELYCREHGLKSFYSVEHNFDGKIKNKCGICGKEIEGTIRRRFCSRVCIERNRRKVHRLDIRIKHRKESRLDNIRHKHNKKIRKYNYDNDRKKIFFFFGNKCALCQEVATDVHHRAYTGDWKDCVPVCKVCHGTFNHYQREHQKGVSS